MNISCVWEHNGDDTLLYAVDFPGAYSRGASLSDAMSRMEAELRSYTAWAELPAIHIDAILIQQNAPCKLQVCDADSDVLFDSEKQPLTMYDYQQAKRLVLKSASDFVLLFDSIPQKQQPLATPRTTFYGQVPVTAEQMYRHVMQVNDYYFGEIEVTADRSTDIVSGRQRGFAALEEQSDFLQNRVYEGSYGEAWTLRKVMRRFLWHDRIHAKALYRRAINRFGQCAIQNPFMFGFTPNNR